VIQAAQFSLRYPSTGGILVHFPVVKSLAAARHRRKRFGPSTPGDLHR